MLQRQGIFLDETSVVSNLTSATSNDATTNNNRNEVLVGTTNSTQLLHVPNHQNFMSSTCEEDLITHHQPPSKKKRSLPGNPDPDADVVALSPKSLMATNRFVCEICNKGFPRDQNLQLHRRGHNLPWKLKQRNKNEVVKRKVYICPETSCVHHDPSRALGDLTGIKKHFSRKHGEKKYKCDKCSKRYAVQSDWKAHSKICGTREYRCDCGTLFSRRDSFITHRAFCDALAEESSSRSMTHPNNNNPHHHHQILHNVQRAHNNLNHHQHLPPWLLSSEPAAVGVSAQNPQILNPFVTTASASLMLRNQSLVPENPNIHIPNNENSIIFPTTINSTCTPPSSLTSATALLQKAAQMGVTMCTDTPHQTSDVDRSSSSYHHHVDGLFAATSSYSSNITAGFMPSREGCWHAGLASLENKQVSDRVTGGVCMETNNTVVVGGMNPSSSSSFAFDQQNNFNPAAEKKNDGFRGMRSVNEGQRLAGNDQELTRDFLGLRAFPDDNNKDQLFISMSGLRQMGSSSYDHRQTQDDHQLPWQQISQ